MFTDFYDSDMAYYNGLHFLPAFTRGLPKKDDLLGLAFSADIIRVLRELVNLGYYRIETLHDALEKSDAVDYIIKNGWAYRHLKHVEIPGPRVTKEIWDIMVPASPLHRAWLTWIIANRSFLPF